MGYGGYGGNILAKSTQGACESGARSFTVADQVDQAIAQAGQRLKAAQRARQILDANPDIEELINLLGQF